MVILPRSRSLTPTYILLLLPWEYAKTCLFTPKYISYTGRGSKKIIRSLNKYSKIMIYLFSKFIVKGRRSFVKKERKKKREKKREKKKSMISVLRSSLLASKKGERRYPKTSATKFFINSSVGGSLSRSKVELG
jgi:hypothetical protein